jgi:uncharacterized membrane protein YjgN (DUF898 family)
MAGKKYRDEPMPLGQFDIVFCGLREGFDEAQVQAQFASLFKLDAAKTRRIFAAKKVTLKANINESLADKYVTRLAAIGVVADKLATSLEFNRELPAAPAAPAVSRAIRYRDHGEESGESSSMHQAVDFAYGPDIRRIPFVFDARARDYANIWLVNVLVCLLSAGLLWPWVRARSQRFFYQHTSLDNVQFGYRSHISKVLLIQLTLVAALLGLLISALVWPVYAIIASSVFFAVMPLALQKLQEFRLRNAFYGEHAWHYTAAIKSTYIAFLAWPLLIIVTLGLAAPWAMMQIQRHLVESRSCNQINFSFHANWKLYLPLLPPLLIANALSLVVLYLYWKIATPAATPALVFVVGLAWLLVAVRWRVLLSNLFWNSIRCPLGYFIANGDLYSYQKMLLRNCLSCMLTFGLYWPWAKIASADYKARHLAFFANPFYKKWRRTRAD